MPGDPSDVNNGPGIPEETNLNVITQLETLRNYGGKARTKGLSDDIIQDFSERDSRLSEAIEDAISQFDQLLGEYPELLAMSEADQIRSIQSGMVNFYAQDSVSPFVTLAARGPWIITLKGAVVHDSGGYGMLGFGHAPKHILEAMSGKQVMANVMTSSISQKRLTDALSREIGHSREDGCPFSHYLFLNSGSESVTVAARISDINAKIMTDPGGRYAGCQIRKIGLSRAFHGRTDRPAQFSDSTRKTYSKHLASFRDNNSLITVDPNNSEQLKQAFEWAEENNVFIEALFVEPVMGEGDPGMAITPEFYQTARECTRQHGSLMLVDSIQAGLRAHGVLSICDYPGFEKLDPPDMETYSKALNGGQYPLSVLSMTPETASMYRHGVYGNTMTSNPRAMEVACAVLDSLTPELRNNIRVRGQEFVDKLLDLQNELGDAITGIQGTGLLFSAELKSDRYRGYGIDSTEEYMRINGINVIHGGENSLRYTPHFAITSEEVDLIINATRTALIEGPVKAESKEPEAASAAA